ncbi:MAG: restriction endonuclease subunit S, partial [Bacteroidales bacterium]|nr:restriction endonuclease subunit S [Bacteroidales bacterium]
NRFTVKSNRSEVLFVDYMAEHLTPNGRAAIIVPEGIIFQSGTAYKQLRKMLVDDYLVGVISLPAGVFNPYSGVKTSILWLDKALARKTNNILFVKIAADGFDLGAQRRPIKENSLPEALKQIGLYKQALLKGNEMNMEAVPNFSLVDKSKIAAKGDYNLSGERYITISKILTKYDLVSLAEICEFNNGLWTGKKEPLIEINVIRNTNFRNDGRIDWSDIANLDVEVRQYENRELKYGDIIIEKSGGGPTQPVGRVVFFNKTDSGFSYSNFTSRIRLKDERMLPEFLWLMLWYFYQRGETEKFQNRTSGIRNLDFKSYQQIQIPLPPLFVQQEIVKEIEGYQKIIDGARMVIENYKPQIKINPEWEMVELGEVCDFVRGPFGGSLKKEIFKESGIAVYEQSHAIYNQFDDVRYFIDEVKYNEMRRFQVFPGDLIMSCSGTMGKVAIIPNGVKKGIINQALLKLTPKEPIDVHYLKLWMESDNFQQSLKSNVYGAAIQNVASVNVLQSLKLNLPPKETQKQIISQIEKEQDLINSNKKLIEIYEQKIKERIAEVWGEDKVEDKSKKAKVKPYIDDGGEALMAAEG